VVPSQETVLQTVPYRLVCDLTCPAALLDSGIPARVASQEDSLGFWADGRSSLRVCP